MLESSSKPSISGQVRTVVVSHWLRLCERKSIPSCKISSVVAPGADEVERVHFMPVAEKAVIETADGNKDREIPYHGILSE